MRKLLLAAAAASLAGTALLAVAAPDQAGTEAKAYLNYSFGGPSQKNSARLHYGLRMDYTSPYSLDVRPPLMQLDFDRAGLTQTRINGLSVVQRLRLNQDEVPPPAEEAPAEGDSSGDSSSESGGESGGGTEYSIIDWSLIAVGAIGIGFVIAETLDTEDSPTPPPAEEPEEGGGLLLGTLNLGLMGDNNLRSVEDDRQHQRWLDGGTGQMGDLGG